MASVKKQLDELYSSLFETYSQKTHEDYVKERKIVKDKLNGMNYDFEYTGYIPYPENDDDNFNEKIYYKKEFNRNKTNLNVTDFDEMSSEKCSQNSFMLTPNQRFIKGFMSPSTPYNGLLLYHGVGVGKTCTAISIAEQYHDIYQKRVLVILSSTLIDNFKKQIFDITKYDVKSNTSNLCTGTKYPDMVLDKHKLDKDALERKINKLINDKYQFIGYKELAILMEKIKSKIESNEVDAAKIEKKFNERLSDMFSDRLIIIDEAHNLRNPSETGKKQISNAFKTLLTHLHNVKLVLLTATPMFNNAKEIAWTLNLLLTNDKRPELTTSMLFDKQGNLTSDGKRELIKAARGYVSFMRGENPFAFPFRLFPSINNDPHLLTTYPKKDIYGKKISKENKIRFLEIISSDMSIYQKRVYDAFKKKIAPVDEEDVDDLDEDEEDQDEGINNDLQNTMQISNIVYPSLHATIEAQSKDIKKLYGSQGLESCFNKTDKGKYSYRPEIVSKYKEFLSYNEIQNYAPKIKRILDYIINSKGIVFVYSRYYPAGIIPLAIALEHIGFVKYGSNTNVTQNITVTDKFGGKKPQYIVLSKKKDLSPNNMAEIAAVKSANNKDGEQIKVIIVSKIGTEGIDFKRIREVHLLEPWFNLNRAEQIIGRAVRYCSHVDLPKSKRNVTIYFHACTYDDDEESVDLRTYRIAEQKQKRISEIEQILKDTSIDCNLNKKTLTYPTNKLKIKFDIQTSQGTKITDYNVGDKDFSYVCGFAKCKASCEPEMQDDKSLNVSTFDKTFIQDDIDLYKRYVASLYESSNNYSYEQIVKYLKKEYSSIDEEVLLYSLEDMISNKYILTDSKGRSGYLIYRSNQYIFQYTRMSNTRMTLDEREDETVFRKHLPLKELQGKIQQKNAATIATNAPKSVQQNAKNATDIVSDMYLQKVEEVQRSIVDGVISALDSKHISEIKENTTDAFVLKYIKSTFKELPTSGPKLSTEAQKAFDHVFELMKKLDDNIVDSIIDRLSVQEYESLLHHMIHSYNNGKTLSELEKKCLRSLVVAGVVIEDTNTSKIKYFYNHFDSEMYCLKTGNKFKKCNATDIPAIATEYSSIQNKVQDGIKETTKAYVTMKSGKFVFKIKDNSKTDGYVCQNTSSLMIEDLKNKINTIIPGLAHPNLKLKYYKPQLCYLFEILMRSYSPEVFQRPFFIKIETKK